MFVRFGRLVLNTDHIKAIDIGEAPEDPVLVAIDWPDREIRRVSLPGGGGREVPGVAQILTLEGPEALAMRKYLRSGEVSPADMSPHLPWPDRVEAGRP